MRFEYYIVVLVVLLFSACNEKKKDLRETDYTNVKKFTDGQSTQYREYNTGEFVGRHKKGDGFPGYLADSMIIRYTGRVLDSDKTIFITNDKDIAEANNLTYEDSQLQDKLILPANIDMIKGLKNGLPRLYEGDSASIAIPFTYAYGESGTGLVPPYTAVIFDVEVIKTSGPKITAEKNIISNYLKSHPELKTKVTELVYKNIVKDGTGTAIKAADTVKFDYKITTLDNTIVLEAKNDSIYVDNLSFDQIYAFDLIINGAKKGDSIDFIAPSFLNVRSDRTIYEDYIPLIYHIKINEVRTKKSS